jgi:hypothetical protein
MENDWVISTSKNEAYGITMPSRIYKNIFKKPTKNEEEEIIHWANIKTKIVTAIMRHFVNDYFFIRLYTYYQPEQLLVFRSICQIESVPQKRKSDYLYLIPECRDSRLIQNLFETGTLEWRPCFCFFNL